MTGRVAERAPLEDAAALPVRLASRVEVADAFFPRLLGLMGRALGEGEGLYIAPCASIHTFFMRVPIDAAFLDEEGRAVALFHALAPGRVTRWVPGARGVLELPAGTLAARGFREGQRVDMAGWTRARGRGRLAGRWAANLALGGFWLYLAARLLPALARGEGGAAAAMLFAVNTLIALLFVTRREEKRLTGLAKDRVVTFLSVLLSFSLLPAPGASLIPAGWASLLLALCLGGVFLAYLSLGRSFGLVPADRGLKTAGLYRWVRHPLYGAEMAFFACFLLANFTARNAAVTAGLFVSLHLRALAEERLLAREEAYRSYSQRVRARYIPRLV
ncbi:MAG: hypothetical protein A3J27_14425 [Candidatus Tectomicrobia bacterium RIFCSPLOWO2_12_FULL_69_37]|nr:MAG: hypothetical protein A3I72_14200 [Candidatus Tectomicrobia bacterium RIFCSPLOWO2_02_FULL_70_19]OGL62758.1 MAG: hypothetical protein A3J27_14425 [Candidatus Tectomicrobia bacterium RIFCSPLOWO2_12_FULL_69_37]